VTGAFKQKPDGRPNRAIIVYNQDFCQSLYLRPDRRAKSTAGCSQCLPKRPSRASTSRHGKCAPRLKTMTEKRLCARLRADTIGGRTGYESNRWNIDCACALVVRCRVLIID
jgi:hypothetical protein